MLTGGHVRHHARMDDTSTSDAARPDESRRTRARLARRRAEIGTRLRQLRVTAEAIGARRHHGSTAAEVALARRAATRARENALTAHEWAARRHEDAAAVHDRAAALFAACGDDLRAGHHQAAAVADRVAALAEHRRGTEQEP